MKANAKNTESKILRKYAIWNSILNKPNDNHSDSGEYCNCPQGSCSAPDSLQPEQTGPGGGGGGCSSYS